MWRPGYGRRVRPLGYFPVQDRRGVRPFRHASALSRPLVPYPVMPAQAGIFLISQTLNQTPASAGVTRFLIVIPDPIPVIPAKAGIYRSSQTLCQTPASAGVTFGDTGVTSSEHHHVCANTRHASAGWHLPDQPDSQPDPSLRWGDG
jgi:hypothetical protein